MKLLLLPICSLAVISYSMEQPDEQNWSAQKYDQYATHQYDAAVKLIGEHIPEKELASYHEILDVGCGPGNVTFYFKKHTHSTAHVHGVDKSQEMIHAARQANRYNGSVTFDVFDANADFLTFKDQFDLVFCSATLHWIKEQEKLFNGMIQSTAKDGVILIKTATMSSDHPLLRAFADLKQDEPWKTQFAKTDLTTQFFPLQQEIVKQWCITNKLKIDALYTQPNQFHFKNQEELICWFDSWFGGFSAIAKLPQRTRTLFITNLVKKYTPYVTNKEDGSITHGWPQLILKATKPYRSESD